MVTGESRHVLDECWYARQWEKRRKAGHEPAMREVTSGYIWYTSKKT